MKPFLPLALALAFPFFASFAAEPADSLPAIKETEVPRTVSDLYKGFDPDSEPLELEVIREFQRNGTTIRLLTFTIGTFKGEKSRMAAFYGFPTGHQGSP